MVPNYEKFPSCTRVVVCLPIVHTLCTPLQYGSSSYTQISATRLGHMHKIKTGIESSHMYMPAGSYV